MHQGHVIVRPFENLAPRLPIETFIYDPGHKIQRDLFLQGYADIQARNYSDPTSYFAVAGIHGLPFVAYDPLSWDPEPSTNWHTTDRGRWGGFCHHGDVLFPTWHRPYVLLMEMLIHDAAKSIVDTYDPALNETAEYKKALETLRLPYWDWASPETVTKGMPSIVFEEYVYVDTPGTKNKRIRNPLYSYIIPKEVSTVYTKRSAVKRFKRSKRSINTTSTTTSSTYTSLSTKSIVSTVSIVSNSTYSAASAYSTTSTHSTASAYSTTSAYPTASAHSSVANYTTTSAANYTIITSSQSAAATNSACTRKRPSSGHMTMITGNNTVRHPVDEVTSNMTDANLDIKVMSEKVFRPSVYQLLLIRSWREFSNHGDGEDEPGENFGHFASLEIVHDAVHDSIGGSGGHMAYTDTASFDPIFFLHHANVDRIFAIYQMCHPDVWIVPSTDTEGTYTTGVHERLDANSPLTPFRKTDDAYWTSNDVRNFTALGYTYPDLLEYKEPQKLLNEMLAYYDASELYSRYRFTVTMSILKNKAGQPLQIRVFIDLPTATARTPITDPHFAGLVSVFARNQNDNLDDKEAVVTGSVDLTNCMKRLFIDVIPAGFPSSPILSDQITFVAVLKNGKQVTFNDAGLISADYWITDERDKDDPESWVTQQLDTLYSPYSEPKEEPEPEPEPEPIQQPPPMPEEIC